MSKLIEKLWPTFQADTTEQLETIELSLISAANHGLNDEEVNSLFRYFHTIKGGCAMMGFSNMEELAHACEDLLDPVRNGEFALTKDIINLLISVVDGLKAQLSEVIETRKDPAALPELINSIRTSLSENLGTDVAVAEVNDDADNVVNIQSTAIFNKDCAERFYNNVRAPLRILFEECFNTSKTNKKLSGALNDLQSFGGECEYHGLVSILSCQDFFDSNTPNRLRVYSDFLSRIRFFEEETGYNCGVLSINENLRIANFDYLKAVVGTLEEVVDSAKHSTVPIEQARILNDAVDVFEQIAVIACLFGLNETEVSIKYARQIIREGLRRQASFSDKCLELLHLSANLIREINIEAGEDDFHRSFIATLIDSLKEVAKEIVEPTNFHSLSEKLAQYTGISQNVIELIDNEALLALDRSIKNGMLIAEIESDLESETSLSKDLIDFVSANGRVIGSYTKLQQSKLAETQVANICLIIATNLSEAQLRTELAELDPDRVLFDLRVCGSADTSGFICKQEGTSSNDVFKSKGTVRVEGALLDDFLNKVGEMVMLRNMLSHNIYDDTLENSNRKAQSILLAQQGSKTVSTEERNALYDLISNYREKVSKLESIDRQINGALERIQDAILALRVVPVQLVFNRLPRLIKDLADEQSKEVIFETLGEDVRIDKALIDVLTDPLMHMVRNSIDHGIESPDVREKNGKRKAAKIKLSARQSGSTLIIELEDDGAGLNLSKIRDKALAKGLINSSDVEKISEDDLKQLIFKPGFSTSDTVTEISGRGVGMDVVKTNIVKAGGLIEVHSAEGVGTKLVIKLPISAAIQGVLLVATNSGRVALPEKNVSEIIPFNPANLQSIRSQACIVLRGLALPVFQIDELMNFKVTKQNDSAQKREIVILTDGVHRIGIIVNHVLGRNEIFVRDIQKDIMNIKAVGGASILGDGTVVVIADPENIFEIAKNRAQTVAEILKVS